MPYFSFTAKVQEVDCLVQEKPDENGAEVVISGNLNNIISNTYVFIITMHDEPDVESVGHEWKVVDFRKAEGHKMLL